jgi:hypothetical protein
MAAVTSVSTDQQVWDCYDDNASFREDASVAKAKAFITACMLLMRRRPVRISADGTSADFDGSFIQKALEDAREWLAQNNTSSNGGSVRHLSFSNLRD